MRRVSRKKGMAQLLAQKLAKDRIIGIHVYGNLYGCNADALRDQKRLIKVVKNAVKLASMNLIDLRSWRVHGPKGGVSVIALVKESHISIHTWPRYAYATVDVYTCGEKSSPQAAFQFILRELAPKDFVRHEVNRSSTEIPHMVRAS